MESLPLHHSPGFWLVVPGKRRLGSSRNCVTMTAGNHHPHIRGQGQVLVFQQQFWSIIAVFLKENLTALYFLQKCERGFSTSSRAKVSSRLSLIVVINLLNSFREVIVLADLDWQFWTLEACQFDSSLPLYNRQIVSSFLFSYGLSNRSEFTLSSL